MPYKIANDNGRVGQVQGQKLKFVLGNSNYRREVSCDILTSLTL
jgi:hypothetical protein